MIQRLAAAVLLCAGLVACNENDVPPVTSAFQGDKDVKILDARYVPSSDSAPGVSNGTLTYLIVKLEFTNDLGHDAVPDISNFYLVDATGIRYQAKDSGSSVFTGISNSEQVLKMNDKRVYTVGFRTTDPATTGQIIYEK
jgi:hypothetical protein